MLITLRGFHIRTHMSYDVTNQDDIQVDRLLMKASLVTISHEKKVGKSGGSFMALNLCTIIAYPFSQPMYIYLYLTIQT